MESTIVMINLFGAVALLLVGLVQGKDGVSRAFGTKLRIGLAGGTKGGLRNLRIAQTIFATRDFKLAKKMMEVKVDVRRLEKQSAERHLERLRDGRADSLQMSSLHLDMLRDLKRINAHIVSVAHRIMDEHGRLIESRLRDAG